MSKIVFVVLNSIIPHTIQYNIKYYDYLEHEAYDIANEKHFKFGLVQSTKRWHDFVKSLEKGVYYFFITNQNQDPFWKELASMYGFNEKLVKCSSMPAQNINYPERAAGLRYYLYRW